MILAPILYQIHEFNDNYRAEKTASGGFLLIETGIWRDNEADAKADLDKMMQAERLLHANIQAPQQNEGGEWA